MSTRLASHFKAERIERGLSLGDLARRLGYKNVSGGANHICAFEREGSITEELLTNLADALEIDQLTIEQLIEEDRRQFFAEWNEWTNEPIRPYLVVRLMPAVYNHEELPDEITTAEQAEEYAAWRAAEMRMSCCLVLSRRISVWFDESGELVSRTEAAPGQPNSPYMTCRKSSKPFLFASFDRHTGFKQFDWPKKAGVSGRREEGDTDESQN